MHQFATKYGDDNFHSDHPDPQCMSLSLGVILQWPQSGCVPISSGYLFDQCHELSESQHSLFPVYFFGGEYPKCTATQNHPE